MNWPYPSPVHRHQVINNACASIALLNATLNIKDPQVELGEELTNLQAFSEGEPQILTLSPPTSVLSWQLEYIVQVSILKQEVKSSRIHKRSEKVSPKIPSLSAQSLTDSLVVYSA